MMTNPFPTIQLDIKPGVIDLAWGQPDPALLPVGDMRRAADKALDRYGSDMLSYGADVGAGPLLAWLRERIEQKEGRDIAPDQIMITAGNSDALDQICTLFTQPVDVALVESPTYHLAVRILRDHHLDLVPIPLDRDGLQVDALKQTLADLKRRGRRARLLYTIPTFHNPSGTSLSDSRRRALIELAAAEDFIIVEDDVYRELAYDGSAPPSLWSQAPDGVVLRMGSFAKALAPGLRLGWLNGKGKLIEKIARSGLRDSGGGVNHYAAMTVAAFCEAGSFDTQVERLRGEYRSRRDALTGALEEYLPEAKWDKPRGGFFIWVNMPEGIDTTQLRSRADAHALGFIPGTRFCLDGRGGNSLRLAFSLYPPEKLQEGARRLRAAWRDMS